MTKDKIERKIYYYDIVANIHNTSTNTIVKASNQGDILKNAFIFIKRIGDKLIKSEAQSETNKLIKKLGYITENGDVLYIIVDDIKSKAIKFKIVLARTNVLPFIVKNGRLKSISKVIDGDIAEITHCVLFPETGLMGAEFNFFGARPTAISSYIPYIYKHIAQVICTGKIRNDVFERLVENETYSLFEIGVKNTDKMKVILRNEMGLLGAFFNDINELDIYEISIKRRKTKKKKGFEIPISINEMKTLVNENREDIEHFRVSQGTYKDAIDLLSDKLVCTKKFVQTEDRTIDSKEMYNAIVNYYNSNKELFKGADT